MSKPENEHWHGNVQFLQVAPPTRTGVDAYDDIRHQLEALAGRINGAFGTVEWTPLQYIHRPFLNMRSANGEVIDFVEGFLGFGQQEVSLLNLYYAPDLSIRQTQLPFNPDVVDRYIRDEVKSKQ